MLTSRAMFSKKVTWPSGINGRARLTDKTEGGQKTGNNGGYYREHSNH